MKLDTVKFDRIPQSLQSLNQWILWRTVERDGKPTKVPFQVNGQAAKSNDPATWSAFADVAASFQPGRDAGVGFVFSPDDPFVGIDLDGCRNPETGQVAEWAREIVKRFASYAEVSPSKTGIKIFCCGSLPFAGGKKKTVTDAPRVCGKEPAIEVYDRGRYFAVTGWRVQGPNEPQERQESLEWIKSRYWTDEPKPAPERQDFHSPSAIVERARKYLAKLPAAVSGSGGHNATFHAACVLVMGFDLAETDALGLMHEYNQRCEPRWSDKDLARKVREACKQPGQRGYLKNSAPQNWQRIEVPSYTLTDNPVRAMTLVDAAKLHLAALRKGPQHLLSLGISELDYALGGGVEAGELILFAARPSHGKSAVALQCLHHWTASGLPCAMVSEEMSARLLGKRTLQFVSNRRQEYWREELDGLEQDIDEYAKVRSDCHILEGCGTAERACKELEAAVKEYGIKAAVVDYAQLLRSDGKSRYEQVTNTSIALKQLVSRTGITLLVLCQLSRGIESRTGSFSPIMSDLKDSGQLEQDADVITFLFWPWKMDPEQPHNLYQFFNVKNRNRAINQQIVSCKFLPDRQMVIEESAAESRQREWAEENGSAYNPFSN